MHTLPLLLSLLLTQAAPPAPPTVSAPTHGELNAADQAQAVVSQAFGRTLTPAQGSPAEATAAPASSASGTGSPVLAALLLVLLAGGALFLYRRKVPLPGSSLLIHERVSLGPKRMLALAQWGEEVLLLGVTDSGISLLRTQPAQPPRLLDFAESASPKAVAPRMAAPPAGQAVGFEGSLQAALGEELHRGETTEGDALLEKLRAAAVGLR